MADLPEDRVTPGKPPFTNVGVDCFGPFTVKCGRRHVKRYGVLFTCLAIQVVHIEIANNLDTDSFINALRRFVARRVSLKRYGPIMGRISLEEIESYGSSSTCGIKRTSTSS